MSGWFLHKMICSRSQDIDDMDVMVLFVGLFAWNLLLWMLADYKWFDWDTGLSDFNILAPQRFESRKSILMAAWNGGDAGFRYRYKLFRATTMGLGL